MRKTQSDSAAGPGAIGQRTVGGGVITDETCRCGHSIRRHAPLVFGDVFAQGKGRCRADGCDCLRFRWESFAEEPAR